MLLQLSIAAALVGMALGCSRPAPANSADLVFTGMCDASAGVPIDGRRFVVADDEDNVLRAYDAGAPGSPLWSVDVSAAIGVYAKAGKRRKAPPETDLEAATRIGERALWMTSHGRNSSGKPKPERLKLFATTLPARGTQLSVWGQPYDHLLDDLLADPRLLPFDLKRASELAPKAPGGLNMEGMTARREGGVWIGFRNPIPENRALLVPLLNPERLLQGEKAQLGDPRLLDLGGLGVRAISTHRERYLILAGAFDGSGGAKLFSWDGAGQPQVVADQTLAGLNPEGFFTPAGSGRVLILSDDGAERIDGTECKRLADASKKRFRARWLEL